MSDVSQEEGGGMTVKYVLVNAGDASYPSAWEGSTTFYLNQLNDPHSWKRKLDTSYDKKTGELSWTHTHETNESIYFSYFPPYSYQRHLDLIAKATPYVNCFEIFSLFFYIFSL